MSLDLRFSKVVTEEKCVGDFNITHNLNKMAEAAGIYGMLWRPEENGYKKAGEMLELLERGLADLKAQPDHYKQFNSDNGWGTYNGFINFVEGVVAVCKEHPDADVFAYR
jgi:hypothetical protein